MTMPAARCRRQPHPHRIRTTQVLPETPNVLTTPHIQHNTHQGRHALPQLTARHAARSFQARNLSRNFEAGVPGCSAVVRALRSVSLHAARAEHVALAGGAGAGKSTLLLVLAGMLKAHSGSVEWFGSGGERLPSPGSVEYVPAWRRGHALQSMRRAVASSPGVLLMDDIFADLSIAERDEARLLLRELQTMRVTLLVATRGDPMVLSHCARAVVLKDGRVR
jgi:ABC-type multidrug transport system ATPase subunit